MSTDIEEGDLSTKADALFQTLESTPQIDRLKDQVIAAHSELSTSLQASLISLATIAELALKSNANAKSGEVLLEALANASRDVAWRKPFGPPSIPLDSAAAKPKCVLSVAVSLISEPDNLDEWVTTQALKLIANCCADEAENRRYVVQRNGLTKIVALPCLHDLARFAISALYNVCVDFEDAPRSVEEEANQSSKTNDAERQLALAVGYDDMASIRVMLSLMKDLDKTMYPFLADIIEMASRQAALDPSYLLYIEVTSALNKDPSINDRMRSILSELLEYSGPRLAATSADCCASICNTVTNLLKQDTARRLFLEHDDLLIPFAALPLSFNESTGFDSDSGGGSWKDSMEDLNHSRKEYLKLTYEITAMPELQEHRSLTSPSILSCIKLLKEDAPYSGYLCVILANLTTSLPTAEYLVSEYGIHTAIRRLILPGRENLLPAMSLLIKLALPDSNKTALAKSGIFDSLLSLLENEPPPEVQREIIVAVRLLIKGRPENVALLGPETPSTSQDPRLLNIILWTFTNTKNTALKLEIGRLSIEICRVSFKPDSQDLDDKKVTINPAFANAIAFVALHAEGNACSEGWFGLAAVSVSAQGQERVINVLEANDLRTEMLRIISEKRGPSFENVKLMLTKIHLSTFEIRRDLKADIDAACARLHLAEH